MKTDLLEKTFENVTLEKFETKECQKIILLTNTANVDGFRSFGITTVIDDPVLKIEFLT